MALRQQVVVYDASNHAFRIGAELAAGGEGRVYEIEGRYDVVAKLYHSDRRSHTATHKLEVRGKKIAHLTTAPPRAPTQNAMVPEHHPWAWPIAALLGSDGGFAGFLMPRLEGAKGEEFLQLGSGIRWRSRVAAAQNLASLVRATHEAGYVIGDLNPRNLLFRPFSLPSAEKGEQSYWPSFLDVDSFQVTSRHGDVLFPCEVQNPEYSAPEIIDALVQERTNEQDFFTLAIVIFQLLSLGVHPFLGTSEDTVNQEIRRNIANGRSVFSNELRPPKRMVRLSTLPPALLDLFSRTFREGHAITRARATAREWEIALQETLATGITQCGEYPLHDFGRHLVRCYWCEYAGQLGFDPFYKHLQNLPRPQANQPRRSSDVRAAETPRRGRAPDKRHTRVTNRRESHELVRPPFEDVRSTNKNGADTNRPKTNAPSSLKTRSGVTSPPTRGPAGSIRQRLQTFKAGLLVLAVALVGISAWYLSGTSGLAHRVQSLIGAERWKALGATVTRGNLAAGAFSLSITACADYDVPFDCTGETEVLEGFDLTVLGADGVLPLATAADTVTTYYASTLSAGRYTIELDERNLGEYQRCADQNTPLALDNPVRLDLDSDVEVIFAYCVPDA